MTDLPRKGGVHAAGTASAACFHCGLPLPPSPFPVTVDGVTGDTCCRGCQAVAQTIVDSGLSAYYRTRTAPAPTAEGRDAAAVELGLYDLPDVQRGLVSVGGGSPDEREAQLLIDGVTCAACVWLVERHLAAQPGVLSATLNFATRRARVRWREGAATLGGILRAVTALGYGAHPYDNRRAQERLDRERRGLLWRLFIAGFSMMQAMMYAIPVYLAEGAMTPDIEQLMRWAGLILTAPVVLWSAAPFYAGAWRDLRAHRVGMDVPVSLGVLIAFAASLWATLTASGQVYFDSVAMFVFLLLGARFLEAAAHRRASDAQERLVQRVPAVAERYLSYPAPATEKVAAVSLVVGDILCVRPGAVIPADGEVIEGRSHSDESLLSGEARPVAKRNGDTLVGGAVNLDGVIAMRVTRAGEQTVLAGIVRLLDRAQADKPRVAQVADRVAHIFVAALLLATVTAFTVWWFIDPPRALWVAVSMLVVTCPCALSLATPAALTAATGAAYRAGLLMTRGSAMEALAGITHVVFDKTGTLTTGHMQVVGTIPLGTLTADKCLSLAAALEAGSEHPIGRAIVAAATGIRPVAAEIRNLPGQGLEGVVAGRSVRIGSPAFVSALHGQSAPEALQSVSDAVSVVALGDANGWIALIQLDDTYRHDAAAVVRRLRDQAMEVSLLTGDHWSRAMRVARELGIRDVRAEVSPEDKLAFVRQLQAQGAVVAVVGDGVNDAPMLAQAQVSLALAGGTDLAQTSADVVLMQDDLNGLLRARSIARRCRSIIVQNLTWAVVYNAVALPLAAIGWITPLIAAAGMSLSSLAVVLNALRLMKKQPD